MLFLHSVSYREMMMGSVAHTILDAALKVVDDGRKDC